MVTNYDGADIEFKEVMPLLPIRDLVVYPFMILPLFVGRDASIQAVEHSLNETNRLILLSSQKDITAEVPEPNEIYEMGTVAMIMRMRKLPDGRLKILVQGLSKARITNFEQQFPFFKVRLEKVEDTTGKTQSPEVNSLIKDVKNQLEKIISLGKVLSADILMVLEDITDPGRLADLVASNLNLHVSEAQSILETEDPVNRLSKINEIIKRELEIISLQNKVNGDNSDENSKEYFLREQIKAIKNELGEDIGESDDEFQELRDKINRCQMTSEAKTESLKQLSRLEKMHPDSSESSILRNYLEWMIELPWSKKTDEEINLDRSLEILNEDHFDLEKVKERILEYLAVKSLKGNQMKGPIICFNGPPGVGKTSLGKSIARAIGRNFVRISLGGVKDEAEIRGHRRTYVGSMPGRFVQALKQAKSNNPLILLDEVDKMGGDFRGDPASALLEVLDPEQNCNFRDHYINIPFDLSNVMFIATCNNLEQIPGPLRDRMEVINLSGYTHEEKISISQKYLIPKQLEENGITDKNVEFMKEGISSVIKNFTMEAGLRNLERRIGALCRKVAMKIAKGEIKKTYITPASVEKFLGPPEYTEEDSKAFDEIGVATGLAWTSFGGQILYIEATKMKGKGMTLTGQLGDVMQESAKTAVGYIRSHAKDLQIEEDFFEHNEVHIHLPAGATPKDGPSAGITLATALVSLVTQRAIRKNVAMTGEITLTGKVLPIGGLKEKALAAMRMNIDTVIIPWKNKKDLVEIPDEYRQKLNFIPVKNFSEVINIALIKDEEPETRKPFKSSSTPPNVAA